MSEYWEKPPSEWGNVETWDHFFIEKNLFATRHMSYNTLGAELQILIQNLKPDTRSNEKALAIQHDLQVSNIFHVLHPMLLVWGRRALSLMYTMTCKFCLRCVLYPALL